MLKRPVCLRGFLRMKNYVGKIAAKAKNSAPFLCIFLTGRHLRRSDPFRATLRTAVEEAMSWLLPILLCENIYLFYPSGSRHPVIGRGPTAFRHIGLLDHSDQPRYLPLYHRFQFRDQGHTRFVLHHLIAKSPSRSRQKPFPVHMDATKSVLHLTSRLRIALPKICSFPI